MKYSELKMEDYKYITYYKMNEKNSKLSLEKEKI